LLLHYTTKWKFDLNIGLFPVYQYNAKEETITKQGVSVNLTTWLLLAAWFHYDDSKDTFQNSRSASSQ